MSLPVNAAIAGLGVTEQGKVYGKSAIGFAVEAIGLALADAGLAKDDVDGLLVNPGMTWGQSGTMGSFVVQQAMGFENLRYGASMGMGGATAGAMIMNAALAIEAGLARHVVCVFSDAPLKPPKKGERTGSSGAYGMGYGLSAAYGAFGVNGLYATVAQRHMHQYGTTHDQLGAVAVAQRAWAHDNPIAQMRGRELSLDDYHSSRFVTEPLHLFDCCLVSNGGAAVVVTSAERARDLAKPPVHLRGMAQGHPGGDPVETLRSGGVLAGDAALAQAGATRDDVDFLQLYDCYTITVLITLEDYGFCAKGEAGAFVEEGHTARGGKLPTNTGGGQLSSFYMWGMTPIVEAVTQIRGEGRDRQLDSAGLGMVSGNGGVLSTHSTLILGREAA